MTIEAQKQVEDLLTVPMFREWLKSYNPETELRTIAETVREGWCGCPLQVYLYTKTGRSYSVDCTFIQTLIGSWYQVLTTPVWARQFIDAVDRCSGVPWRNHTPKTLLKILEEVEAKL